MKALFALVIAASPFIASTAVAQDYEDLDEGGSSSRTKKKKKSSSKASVSAEDEVVREIVRGFYMRGGVGGAGWALKYRPTLSPGTSMALMIGNDFRDEETMSMAWEVGFVQAVHQGMDYDEQRALGVPNVQGDVRTYALNANFEVSKYVSRRFGIGLQVGGGVMVAPLLIDETAYVNEVIPEWGVDPGVHGRPQFYGQVGPTIEYYTKLSHFSIGGDIAIIAGTFDIGGTGTGWFKYTF